MASHAMALLLPQAAAAAASYCAGSDREAGLMLRKRTRESLRMPG